MKLRAIPIASLLVLGIAFSAVAQNASSSNSSGTGIPEACRTAAGGQGMPNMQAMPKMTMPADMQAAMAKMSDAQKADMQAMEKMHGPMMMGMMIQDPDVAFVCMMIPHHQSAIDMSRVLLKYGKDAETRKMAEAVIQAQEKEIAEMKTWLGKKSASNMTPVAAGGSRVAGEVMKIDKSSGKITLKHGAIKNLDMEPMTMVFRVSDATMLDKVKEGDKVQFEADRVQGALTVVTIEKAK